MVPSPSYGDCCCRLQPMRGLYANEPARDGSKQKALSDLKWRNFVADRCLVTVAGVRCRLFPIFLDTFTRHSGGVSVRICRKFESLRLTESDFATELTGMLVACYLTLIRFL